MRSIVLGALLLGSASCETVEFYHQAAAGQLSILGSRQPVAELIESPDTDPILRDRLVKVAEILSFAREHLSLDPGRRYTSYVRIDGEYVVWNVFAAPEFSTHPVRWCYPVVGCANYRGYFSRTDAHRYAQYSIAVRQDTTVSGATAYSTLGWFDDPVLSTFAEWPDGQLAGLIFHELAHARVFIPGDTAFNEAYASFVERRGVLEWFRARQDHSQIDRVTATWQELDRFVTYLLNWRDELQRLYDQPYNEVAMRMLKTELIAAIEQCYRANREKFGDRDWFFGLRINNARFVPLAAYNELVAGFAAVFEETGESWPEFYARVVELGRLDVDARVAELERLSLEYRTAHVSDGDRASCDALGF